ncbi:CD276 antigen isoform X1 [Amia ocellicauda]|uniref:CD276 antigen isoform X1 n=1 Tax=Amia ocellicauda TaxID=2972642 RepID=UPI00346387A3
MLSNMLSSGPFILKACCAVLEMKVPEVPVVALFGKDAILNCSFSTGMTFNLSDLSVFWQLTDTKKIVHSFSAGQDHLRDQGDTYINRTSLFHKELASGNASLLLRGVKIADEGSFTCFVRIKEYRSEALQLQVAASYSKPHLALKPESNLRAGDVVALNCHSYGGYPMANILWQDGSGRNLTDNVTTSQVANEQGLFSVLSVLTVMVEPNSNYSCLVWNEVLDEVTHSSVTITESQADFPKVALWVTIGLAVCLLGLLVTLAYICRKKINESCKEGEEAAEGKELEEDESKTVTTPLKV